MSNTQTITTTVNDPYNKNQKYEITFVHDGIDTTIATATPRSITNQEIKEECEANIAYYKGLILSTTTGMPQQSEEYQANISYYEFELARWKKTLDQTLL